MCFLYVTDKKKSLKRTSTPSTNSSDIDFLIKMEKLRKLRLENRALERDNYEKEKRLGLFPAIVIPHSNYKEVDEEDAEFMQLMGSELGDKTFERFF